MPKRMRRTLQMLELRPEMSVEVHKPNTSYRRTGVVAKVDMTRSGMFIDGKPVQKLDMDKFEATIEYENGETVTVTQENFCDYQITPI